MHTTDQAKQSMVNEKVYLRSCPMVESCVTDGAPGSMLKHLQATR